MSSALNYERRAFHWRDPQHPFVQRRLPASGAAHAFRSPAEGALQTLCADHVVQGRVIFPGAGYLELARAAATGQSALSSIYFLQPLATETPELLVECLVRDGRFEIRSGDSDEALSISATSHCSGAHAAIKDAQRVDQASGCSACVTAAAAGGLYDSFEATGLQYGPGYRTLVQAWGGTGVAAARLRLRSTQDDTVVHPADLDDALCAAALTRGEGKTSGTRLPFA
eukprot:4368715-Prymnesium_polylepis.1